MNVVCNRKTCKLEFLYFRGLLIMELTSFLAFLATIWGKLSVLTTLFPLSDILFQIVPTPPRREKATRILATLACILVIYSIFVFSEETANRYTLYVNRNWFFGGAIVLSICAIFFLVYIFNRKDEIENWKKDAVSNHSDDIPVDSIASRYGLFRFKAYYLMSRLGIKPTNKQLGGIFPTQCITRADLDQMDDLYRKLEQDRFEKSLLPLHILSFAFLTASFTVLATLQYIQPLIKIPPDPPPIHSNSANRTENPPTKPQPVDSSLANRTENLPTKPQSADSSSENRIENPPTQSQQSMINVNWGNLPTYFNFDTRAVKFQKGFGLDNSTITMVVESRGNFSGQLLVYFFDNEDIKICPNLSMCDTVGYQGFIRSENKANTYGFLDWNFWNVSERDRITILVPSNASKIQFYFNQSSF